MNQLASKLHRHLKVYGQILSFALKYVLEYRLNFAIRSLHNLFHVVVILAVILVIYQQTPTLGGWTKDEAILLYSIVYISYSIQSFFFATGIEKLMSSRIRNGDVDGDLVKPLNPQFLLTFKDPWIDSLGLLTAMVTLLVRQSVILQAEINLTTGLLFAINLLLSQFIWYFVICSYATISFWVVYAQQVLYLIEKTTDYASYPTHIFPKGIQVIALTAIPIGFMAYVPASILLSKTQPWMWPLTIVMLIGSYLLNKITWEEGLKRYASASS